MGEQKKVVNKKVKKFYIVLGMLLILLIPIAFMSGIVKDRESYKDEAVRNVKTAWADSQVIYAPVLTLNVPDKKGIKQKTLPLNNYEAEIEVKTQIRQKGIFKVPVYTADVELKGDFLNTYGKIKNMNSQLAFRVSDAKGFVSQPQIKFLSEKPVVHTSATYEKKITTSAKNLPFEIKYQIRGINKIYAVPAGINNEIEIEGDWKTPSFDGDFLPSEKELAKDSFEGEWEIPAIATSSLTEPKAGVSFLTPVDNYRMATRAVKYAFLFLSLTFLAYFIFEIASKDKKPIHQLQYLMMGAAMLVFYLLMLSLSEFMPFGFSYFIAALMTIALISTYTYFVITKKEGKKFTLLITLIMALLYAFLYLLLILQDLSMLLGALVLFLIMALVMYSTRNVEWNSDD